MSFISNLTMGIASTAPVYSAALTIGLLAAIAGMSVQSPAVLLVCFVPMFLTATAYRALNSEMPDCGTTFAWAARAIGPASGWLGGWASMLALTFILGIGGALASSYFFLLVGWKGAAGSMWLNAGVGVLIIAATTWLCVLGVDLSARIQRWLLYLETAAVGIFSVVALTKGFTGTAGYVTPSFSWLNPFAIHGFSALADGVLLAVFMYWGWETAVAVAEESEDPTEHPGRAAMLSVVGLVIMYVVVSSATQTVRGPRFLATHSEDVLSATAKIALGSPLDKLLLVAVCTSAVATSVTSLLTTGRMAYSMARADGFPGIFGRVHPRYETPWIATIASGVIGALYFVVLKAVSPAFLEDSVAGVGLLVLFFYATTAFAAAVYFRRRLRDGVRASWSYVLAPALGGSMLTAVMVKAAIDYGQPHAGTLAPVAGIGTPLLIALGTFAAGVILMLGLKSSGAGFFRMRREQGRDLHRLQIGGSFADAQPQDEPV